MVAFALDQQTNGHLESDGRRLIALLAITGSISDARAVYLESTGATESDCFVQDGDPPYVSMVPMTEYQPVMTPQGDCAEDAMPLGFQNDMRRAVEARMVGDASSS